MVMEDREVHQSQIYSVVQSEETTQLQAGKRGKGQRIDLTGRTGKYLRLNAEGRRISESRMRENRTYGLMRGRWQLHCSTLSRIEIKVCGNPSKKAICGF